MKDYGPAPVLEGMAPTQRPSEADWLPKRSAASPNAGIFSTPMDFPGMADLSGPMQWNPSIGKCSLEIIGGHSVPGFEKSRNRNSVPTLFLSIGKINLRNLLLAGIDIVFSRISRNTSISICEVTKLKGKTGTQSEVQVSTIIDQSLPLGLISK